MRLFVEIFQLIDDKKWHLQRDNVKIFMEQQLWWKMATYEDKIKTVGTKVAMLEFTDKETESVIAKGHLLSLERQRKILEKKLTEVHNLKLEIQEAKLECGEEAEEVKAWSKEIEAKLVKFEQSVNNVEKITKEIKRKDMEGKRQAEL